MSRCSTIGSVFIPLSTIEHLSRHGWPWKGSPGLPRNALISPLHSSGGSPSPPSSQQEQAYRDGSAAPKFSPSCSGGHAVLRLTSVPASCSLDPEPTT